MIELFRVGLNSVAISRTDETNGRYDRIYYDHRAKCAAQQRQRQEVNQDVNQGVTTRRKAIVYSTRIGKVLSELSQQLALLHWRILKRQELATSAVEQEERKNLLGVSIKRVCRRD